MRKIKAILVGFTLLAVAAAGVKAQTLACTDIRKLASVYSGTQLVDAARGMGWSEAQINAAAACLSSSGGGAIQVKRKPKQKQQGNNP